MRGPKILIISSDTGGGHRSAAAAIVAGVQKFFHGQSYAVRVIRAAEESHAMSQKLVNFYNWLLRNKQHWMKYLYWVVNRFRPETRGFFQSGGDLRRRHLRALVPARGGERSSLSQHVLASVLKELKLVDKSPLVTVVTDPCYGFWRGWACDDVSLYLVASAEARRQLIDYGIEPRRIKISGMPVHPKFEMIDDRAAQAARRALGLDPQKFTVFVNAGWVGGGNIPAIFRELVRGELDVQAVFLAGRNDELRVEAESVAARAKFPSR
ncbi:MAG: hypothetical protein WKF30_04425 [Pyrinomonadaceae bacterium]